VGTECGHKYWGLRLRPPPFEQRWGCKQGNCDHLHRRRTAIRRSLACKALPRRRLPSFTWESGSLCHSLNRRVSYVVVVNDGGRHPG
jgi:hypothetical protein